MKDFSDYRKNYTKYSLLEDELVKDPFDLFKIWLKMAEDDEKTQTKWYCLFYKL